MTVLAVGRSMWKDDLVGAFMVRGSVLQSDSGDCIDLSCKHGTVGQITLAF